MGDMELREQGHQRGCTFTACWRSLRRSVVLYGVLRNTVIRHLIWSIQSPSEPYATLQENYCITALNVTLTLWLFCMAIRALNRYVRQDVHYVFFFLTNYFEAPLAMCLTQGQFAVWHNVLEATEL